MPTVEENGGGVLVTIQRRTVEDIIASREKSGAVNEESGAVNGGLNVGVNVGVNDDFVGVNGGVNNVRVLKFNKRQIIIKDIINQNPMITAKQMSETLSVTQRTIERDLSVLQKASVIRHEGSDKTGIWVVLEPYNRTELTRET